MGSSIERKSSEKMQMPALLSHGLAACCGSYRKGSPNHKILIQRRISCVRVRGEGVNEESTKILRIVVVNMYGTYLHHVGFVLDRPSTGKVDGCKVSFHSIVHSLRSISLLN
jgi:hypothetical protein